LFFLLVLSFFFVFPFSFLLFFCPPTAPAPPAGADLDGRGGAG
jgi:hypothetical protein